MRFPHLSGSHWLVDGLLHLFHQKIENCTRSTRKETVWLHRFGQHYSLHFLETTINRPHEQFKVVIKRNTYATYHSPHNYTGRSSPPSTTKPSKSLPQYYVTQENQPRRHRTDRIDKNNNLISDLVATGLLTRLVILIWSFKIDQQCT